MLPIYNISARDLSENRIEHLSYEEKQSLALVYMPWGAASRGSIAIGILKQCAKNIGFQPDVHYLNIKFAEKLGLELYEEISVSSAFFPEWFFSSVLFGSNGMGVMKNSWDDLLVTELGNRMAKRLKEIVRDSEALCRKLVDTLIPEFIEECLTSVDWAKYKVIGFSATFAQTLSSLLLAKAIKDRYPDMLILFGGANADSEMGFEIIKAFDWIDYVVHGEAEQTFPLLLSNIFSNHRFEKIPGVSMRQQGQVIAGYNDSQMLEDLNASPVPDYSDYFKEVERTRIDKTVRVKLSFESSRGCWWGAKQHCTFCGLNGNTMSFRKKSASRVYDEILQIANKHRTLTLNAVDNILDMGYFKELLPKLAEADLDLSLFYEVKANLSKQQVRSLAAAGINKIQPGIESFNTDILRLMRKGITAIQNIQLLKWCFEYGIDPQWNILYGFPGEQPEQYHDLPELLRKLTHLRPPVGVSPVIFERFSPYHFEREKFKLTLKPLSLYQMLYPENLINYERVAYYFEGQWEDQKQDPYEYIQPTLMVYQEWTAIWPKNEVFFYYEKGPGFLTLYDNRPLKAGTDLIIRKLNLNEIQTRIYLFCDEIRSFGAIQQMLNNSYTKSPTQEQTATILDQFVKQRLMFNESDRYLSLAVRKNSDRNRHPKDDIG